jgi:hypothetical protein
MRSGIGSITDAGAEAGEVMTLLQSGPEILEGPPPTRRGHAAFCLAMMSLRLMRHSAI